MISLDGFRRYLRPHVDNGEAFLAYWHPHGFAFLRTDPIPRTRMVYRLDRGDQTKPKKYLKPEDCDAAAAEARENGFRPYVYTEYEAIAPKAVSAAVVKKFRKQTDALRISTRLVTVESDGTNITTEGGFDV